MIIVSACLAGINCRFDGRNNENKEIVKLVNEGKAIPVCPEQLGGLSTPRKPCEIKNGRVINEDKEDVTEYFINGANKVLKICEKYNCKKAILKSKSPSCGSDKIFNGEFNGVSIDGDGITTMLLKENGIEVISELAVF